MDLDHVSVENSPFSKDYFPAKQKESISPPKGAERSKAAPSRSIPQIEKILQKFFHEGLFGQAYVREYLIDKHRRNLSHNTIRTTGMVIRQFLTFLKDIGKEQIETIDREDISAFVEHEQDRGLRPTSVSLQLQVLYAFFNYLVDHDVLHPDILKRKIHVKVPNPLPRAIDPEDVKEFLDVPKDPRDDAMILILLRTGMRIGELLDLRVKDLNVKEQTIEIFEAQKNRTGRVVYLSEDALAAVKKWLRLRKPHIQYLFYGPSGRPLTYPAARNVFMKYLDKAGLSHKDYTPHCLRHTFASEMLNAGMSLQNLQSLLGHNCIEMTRRYARLTDNTRREQYYKAMEKIERGDINGHYRFDPELP